MSLVSTTAFILKLDPLSEKDLVVALLTKDHGVVRAAVRGARGKSKRAAALQLLTEVSLTYFRREGADLARVDGLEIVASAFDLASRSESAMLLPYLAESALTFVPESEQGGTSTGSSGTSSTLSWPAFPRLSPPATSRCGS